jgi:hypothetical protein
MKCVCGYEYDWDKPESPDNRKFIHIIGTFYISKEFYQDERVNLMACPKCHTIQLNND